MSFYGWRPYVPVAERRRQAQHALAKLQKKGEPPVAPVAIAGRTIAASFWGKSWCDNLERYSDFENRLPRGRTYVRNGSVVDLQITKGEIVARVAGSSLYAIKISIAPVGASRWKAICRDCAGTVDSLIELLQGRFAKGVMDRVCREGDGLFPAPQEIKLSCSCPDWASMCKHVAAALYGVGARLDEKPQLLFVLRGVDENELLAGAGQDLALTKSAPDAGKLLGDRDVAALFGLDMADSEARDAAPIERADGTAADPVKRKRVQRSRATKQEKIPTKAKTAARNATRKAKEPPVTKRASAAKVTRRNRR